MKMDSHRLLIVGNKLCPFKAEPHGVAFPLHASSCDTQCMRPLVASVAWGIEEIWSRTTFHISGARKILRGGN